MHAQFKNEKTFIFGCKTKSSSGISINKKISYNETLGYGFDYNSEENIKINKASVSSKKSIYFSVKLPEGNYRIDITLGGKKESITTVKAESRRLMIKELKTSKNEISKQTFTVNVRTPKISENNSIKIKDRDKNQLNWDNKLTLEFSGTPILKSLKVTPLQNVRTLFLAGDSTVTDQDQEPWASWGQFITNYFNSNIVVANYAESGAALNSFIATNRLDKIMSLIAPGDYLFIEFGHNDEKQKGEGFGPWESYANALTDYVKKARAKGAIPVLVTPTQRRAFNNNGTLKFTHGEYPDAMRKVAKDLQVPLIDLTKMTTEMYEAWGDANSRKAFVQYPANTFPGQTTALEDNTHFNSFGANEIAKCIAQGIIGLNLDIAKYIKPNFETYNPKKPDSFDTWNLPMSTRFEIKKPDGN